MAFVCLINSFGSAARQIAKTKSPDDLIRLGQSVEHSLEPFKSLVLSRGGTIISDDISNPVYELNIHHIGDIQALVNRFKEHTKLECWAGIGATMDDAVRAAETAKEQNLDKPFLMQEDIQEEEPPKSLNIAKSEEEELNKSLKNALRGAGVAALLSMGRDAPPVPVEAPAPAPAAAIAKQPQKQVLAPVKLKAPNKVPLRLKDTFAETHDPKTLHYGTNDAMFLIGLTESGLGRDMLHIPQVFSINHPLTGKRMKTDNTAFGHFGMRPWTAFDTFVKHHGRNNVLNEMSQNILKDKTASFRHLSPQAKKQVIDGITNNFMKRFKTDPVFYNQIGQLNLNRLIDKYGKRGENGSVVNPMDVMAGWRYGEFADPNKVQADPMGYKRAIAQRLGEYKKLKGNVDLNFADIFGPSGHEAVMAHLGKE